MLMWCWWYQTDRQTDRQTEWQFEVGRQI